MRLHEIFQLDELKPSEAKWLSNYKREKMDPKQCPREIDAYLCQNGYTQIGAESAFAWVYGSKNSKSVVKVSQKPDPAWVSFVDFCSQHRGNPHLPKMARKLIQYNNEGYFIAFMELLKESMDAPDQENIMLAYCMTKFPELYPSGPKRDWNNAISFYYREAFHRSPKKQDLEKMYRAWIKRNPLFESTLKLVLQHKQEWRMDLHSGNIMYRRTNNKFVIVDPYFGLHKMN